MLDHEGPNFEQPDKNILEIRGHAKVPKLIRQLLIAFL
jgi:hypothetical protein